LLETLKEKKLAKRGKRKKKSTEDMALKTVGGSTPERG